MAKAWGVTGLRASMPLRSAAQRILAVRIAEFYSYAPFLSDPARVAELHDMRIAAKRLRYTLEIFRVCFPPAIDGVLEQVKAIQELLGQIHDADVLMAMLEDRLAEIAREEHRELAAQLSGQPNEEARLAAIRASLAPRPEDRRVGLYALLGRTMWRRQRGYANLLDLWATLGRQQFRRQLERLMQTPETRTLTTETAGLATLPDGVGDRAIVHQ